MEIQANDDPGGFIELQAYDATEIMRLQVNYSARFTGLQANDAVGFMELVYDGIQANYATDIYESLSQ